MEEFLGGGMEGIFALEEIWFLKGDRIWKECVVAMGVVPMYIW
jgi:hypothetical protein